MNDRLFPARPILAVSAAVFRDGRVLIVRRARAPLIGHFSLPGGVVEIGETLAEAVARELMEEVGVSAEIIGFNRHLDAIAHEGGRVRTHFVIASFVARWTGGRSANKRRSRSRRLDRPGRPPAVADDAGLGRNSGERGADRKRGLISAIERPKSST